MKASRSLNIHKKYLPFLERFGGRKRTWNKVIFYLIHYGYEHDFFDHDKVIETLQVCDPMMIYPQNFERLLESIQKAYNYNKKKKTNRLYFYEEYRLDNKL